LKQKKLLPPEFTLYTLPLLFDLYTPTPNIRVRLGKNNYLLFTVQGDFRYEWDDPLWQYTDGIRVTRYSVYARRHYRLSPVNLARRLCDCEVPLAAKTAPGIVAEWLLDRGKEDSYAYRLLMWCHWNL
jgi:hypothetical protein